jgi:hypothetical protein
MKRPTIRWVFTVDPAQLENQPDDPAYTGNRERLAGPARRTT